jgi:uncharacterized protein (TIGR00730 family)
MVTARLARTLSAGFLDRAPLRLQKRHDFIPVIALNLDDAVLCGAAGAAQPFEFLRKGGNIALGQSGHDAHHARPAPFLEDANDSVVRHGILHDARVRQAAAAAPPNRTRMIERRIAVFCGARTGSAETYAKLARTVARALVSRNIGIVYGGGRVGLMGVLADAALEAGGEVVGVIPRALSTKEIAHDALTQLHVVESMHERKALIADLSDAFVAMPGGYGTMDEFCEILTWAQLRIHDKPIGLLNAGGYYDELLALFEKFAREGFVPESSAGLFTSAATIDELLASFADPMKR